MTNEQMHDTLKGITDNRRTIVTHSGTAHFDELMGIAIILAVEKKRLGDNWDPPTIIRTRNEELIKAGDILVDVGGENDPGNMRFDHHEDNERSAFHMIAEHFFDHEFLTKIRCVHPWWDIMDKMDREGSDSLTVDDWKKVPLALVGAGLRGEYATRHFIQPDDFRYKMLLQIGMNFIQGTIDVMNNIETMLEGFEYKKVKDYSIFITPERAKKDVFETLWRALGKRADITVSQDAQGHYAIYSQEDAVDLTALKSSDANFVHAGGFLAVFSTMDKAEKGLDRLLSSL